MKVKYIKETAIPIMTYGKVYEVLSIERGYYRIMDDTNDDYLYAPTSFEIIDDSDREELIEKGREHMRRDMDDYRREYPEEYRELVERRRKAHPERYQNEK